jgi:tetratricopeptide (TPR) repeat protein
MITKISLLFTILLLISANVFAETIKLKSDPTDATVYVRDLNGTQNFKVGVTPYEASINDLAANYAKSNFFLVVIEKNGYESQSLLISDLLKSDLELSINLIPKDDVILYRKLDKTMNDLFEAQRLMRGGQYDEAVTLLKTVETDQPKLSIIPELIGSAFYLKKDNKGSLSWYEKAYRMNPENKDAYTMKSYLRKSLGADDGK